MCKQIGNSIKKRRKNLKITQDTLAELSDVSLKSLKLIETGKANPTLETLTKLSDTLGLEITLQVKQIKFN